VTFRTLPLSRRAGGLGLATVCACLALSAPAAGSSGGVSTDESGDGGGGNCVSQRNAKLVDGKAVPPCNAPGRVVRVIRAANEIAKGKGYCYGGGHASFQDNCYDCSGAVSYALHGGDLVKRPMPSSGYFTWGSRGRGEWITVYTHSGHMYAVIAGLRFDTSMTAGEGPGWSGQMRSSDGFRVRHKGKL
jgi:hypothetical protein